MFLFHSFACLPVLRGLVRVRCCMRVGSCMLPCCMRVAHLCAALLLMRVQVPRWDTSKLRAKGARLKTFGGRASGPEPLEALFLFAVNLFRYMAFLAHTLTHTCTHPPVPLRPDMLSSHAAAHAKQPHMPAPPPAKCPGFRPLKVCVFAHPPCLCLCFMLCVGVLVAAS